MASFTLKFKDMKDIKCIVHSLMQSRVPAKVRGHLNEGVTVGELLQSKSFRKELREDILIASGDPEQLFNNRAIEIRADVFDLVVDALSRINRTNKINKADAELLKEASSELSMIIQEMAYDEKNALEFINPNKAAFKSELLRKLRNQQLVSDRKTLPEALYWGPATPNEIDDSQVSALNSLRSVRMHYYVVYLIHEHCKKLVEFYRDNEIDHRGRQ